MTTALSDPALTYLGAYLQAYLNAYGLAAWQSVVPGQQLVKSVWAHDPRRVVFNEKDLPAIYLYRKGGGRPTWIASDFRICEDEIVLLWVSPPVPQAKEIVRTPAANMVVKLIDVAIERVRDPCFVLAGDTDPLTTRQGSDMMAYTGFWRLEVSSWDHALIDITTKRVDADFDTRTYDGVQINLRAEEKYTPDFKHGDTPYGVIYHITEQGLVVAEAEVFQE